MFLKNMIYTKEVFNKSYFLKNYFRFFCLVKNGLLDNNKFLLVNNYHINYNIYINNYEENRQKYLYNLFKRNFLMKYYEVNNFFFYYVEFSLV